jgi:hypothetical protein
MFSELVGHVTPARKPIHADVGLLNREVGEPAVILVVRHPVAEPLLGAGGFALHDRAQRSRQRLSWRRRSRDVGVDVLNSGSSADDLKPESSTSLGVLFMATLTMTRIMRKGHEQPSEQLPAICPRRVLLAGAEDFGDYGGQSHRLAGFECRRGRLLSERVGGDNDPAFIALRNAAGARVPPAVRSAAPAPEKRVAGSYRPSTTARSARPSSFIATPCL